MRCNGEGSPGPAPRGVKEKKKNFRFPLLCGKMGGEISLCACDEPSTRPDAPKAREPRAQGQGPHPQ